MGSIEKAAVSNDTLLGQLLKDFFGIPRSDETRCGRRGQGLSVLAGNGPVGRSSQITK